MKYDLLVFDLDGTLLDTSPGIFNSVRYAEKSMHFTPVPDSELCKFVGPPPKEMYKKIYGVSEEIASEAAKKHREYGRSRAIYEANPYPQVLNTLIKLKSEGYALAVATLKSKPIADEVLKIHNLYDTFDVIVGMDADESLTKSDTIAMADKALDGGNRILMIGDSLYDYQGAVAAKADFLGVTYGFGFSEKEQYVFDTIGRFEEINDYLKYGGNEDVLIYR